MATPSQGILNLKSYINITESITIEKKRKTNKNCNFKTKLESSLYSIHGKDYKFLIPNKKINTAF